MPSRALTVTTANEPKPTQEVWTMTRRRFSRVLLCVATAAAILLVTASAMSTAVSAAVSRHCAAPITATFGHGPDAGLSLVGKMSITLAANGQLTGGLTHRGEAKPIKVGGMLRNNRLLGLSFDLHSKLRLFATGKSFHVVHACNDLPMGGNTYGPRPGDTVQWFGAFWHDA
jgi:hypothetical protein